MAEVFTVGVAVGEFSSIPNLGKPGRNEMLEPRKVKFEYPGTEIVLTLAFAVLAVLVLNLLAAPLSRAQQRGQRTFSSAEEASRLFMAAQQDDERELLDILGPEGKEVVYSGDPVEDIDERVSFVVKYEQMHRLAREADGTTTLYVGAENWPFPIPLVNKNNVWFFDTDAGKEEILLLRIGQNELAAMDACHELVEAEQEYYKRPVHGESHYTARFVSDKGKHNGLCWSEADDEFDSTVNPLIAYVGLDTGDSVTGSPADDPIPCNGYYFRILTGAGNNLPEGARSYFVDGKMIGGFAFVAYPAEYRSSGVMTFIS